MKLIQCVAVLAAFFAVTRPARADERSYEVGVIASLTGIAADYGRTARQALTLAAEKANAEPGMPRINLTIEDDRSDSKAALSAYHKLRERKVDAIIGASWDFLLNPLFPLAGRDKQPLFVTSVPPGSLNLAASGGYGFVSVYSNEEDAKPWEKFVTKNGVKSAAFVYANNSWGEAQRTAYRAVAEKHQVEIVFEDAPLNMDDNTWEALVPKIRAKSPRAVALLLNKNDIRGFLRKAREAGFSALFFGSPNVYDGFSEDPRKELFADVCFSYPLASLEAHPEFVEAYRSRYGEGPRIYANNHYDAVFLFQKAFAAMEREKLSFKEALERTAHSGLVGEYRFSPEKSFSVGTPSLVCVRKGARVIED